MSSTVTEIPASGANRVLWASTAAFTACFAVWTIFSIIGLGSIALSRHRFADALELGRRAEAVAAGEARALGIQVDALVELGRYDEAEQAVGRMVRARPDLSPGLEHAIMRALALDPAARWPSVRQLGIALTDAASAETPSDTAPRVSDAV